MTAAIITEARQTENRQVAKSISLDHLTAIPKFIWIAEEVAQTVYDSISHDRLESLRVAEVGEMLDGPEPLLKVVWNARWNDGHKSSFQFMISERFAESNLAKLPFSMEHRLLRALYREDTYLLL